MAESPFDTMAGTYDSDFTTTDIGRLQREKVWRHLLPVLRAYNRPLNILEINCGTGEDALHLANMGHRVFATDASPCMIDKAREKAAARGTTYNLRFATSDFASLPTLCHGQTFDIVFSNFGGLNCIDEENLSQLSTDLATLTTPGASLVFVVMGKRCLWEMLYYASRANFKKAFRRYAKSTQFKAGEKELAVYYYSPRRLSGIFSGCFSAGKPYAVGLMVPPSYMSNFFKSRQSLLARFNRWDNGWGNHPVFAGWADHFCITLKKRKA